MIRYSLLVFSMYFTIEGWMLACSRLVISQLLNCNDCIEYCGSNPIVPTCLCYNYFLQIYFWEVIKQYFFVGLTILISMCRTVLYERIMNSLSAMLTATILFFVLARMTFSCIDRLKNLRRIVKIPVSVCTDNFHIYSYIELTSVKQQSGYLFDCCESGTRSPARL